MYKIFQILLSRIRFYILLLGIFLGLEIPLVMFTFLKLFPGARNFVWFITIIVGLLSAYIVNFMITGIIKDDYKMKIIFDNRDYDKGESDEKV